VQLGFAASSASLLALCLAAAAGAASSSASTTIPLRIRENYALVEVRVGGKSVPLLFDTGDSRGILLAQPVLDRASAKPTGESSKVIDIKGNVVEAPRYEIPRLQIGSIELTRVIADLDLHDPGPMTSQRLLAGDAAFGPWTFEVVELSLPPGFEGFIGYDFYAKHVVCMDFPGKRLLVRRSS
jgi:hypothetical protein